VVNNTSVCENKEYKDIMKIKPYNKDGYIIRISETPLIQMILNGLEAYNVHEKIIKRNQKKIETMGLLWGHEHFLDNKLLYCIEMMSIETSAERHKSYVMPNDDSLKLKGDIITSFWPQYDFLGDFHSHPYGNYNDVNAEKGYRYSNGDYKFIENDSDKWNKYNYRVGLVLTISTMERRGTRPYQWIDNYTTIEFTLGNCRMWLKGYVTYSKEDNVIVSAHDDKNVYLDCPALVGLFGEHTPMKKLI
jgi:hypothetical protein